MAGLVQERYAERVAGGQLAADPEQERVLPFLEAIRVSLVGSARRRGLRGLLARPSEQARGLYLWGGVGRGKSMLMDLFVETVEVPHRRVHFHAFMQEIHAGLHEARARGVEDALGPVADKVADEVRLLAFDELQITDIADAMIVGRLFERLLAAGVAVVTTSNRPPSDLYKNGLNRALFLPFIDLINDRMVVHHLASPTDYRQDMLADTQRYIHPADALARAAIDDLWHELAGSDAKPLTLAVKGRQVVLPAFAGGVARARFWDLCGQPLGPGDYLAIAAAVRVLILEDVPLLGRSNFNEARRFVTLIDALYEARVELVISAADLPEQLYVEGEGTFEFARTASRLREMQSAGWAAEAVPATP